MAEPYYADEAVTLYLGDCREVLPALGVTADCIVADPPYGETSASWDKWPDGWLGVSAQASRSLWCFGSLRMFGERWQEYAGGGWKFSQDVVMEKGAGAGAATDRFRRVHETITHWYSGYWRDVYHAAPRVPSEVPDAGSKAHAPLRHLTGGKGNLRTWTDDGTRYARTVLRTKARRGGRSIHRAEKPVHILRLLVEYACPPGGLVIDPFAGSASTLVTARMTGRRAIGVEVHEPQAEEAAKRLSQGILEIA